MLADVCECMSNGGRSLGVEDEAIASAWIGLGSENGSLPTRQLKARYAVCLRRNREILKKKNESSLSIIIQIKFIIFLSRSICFQASSCLNLDKMRNNSIEERPIIVALI